MGAGRLLEGRRGALVTPQAEAGTTWGLEATGILHPPRKGTRDTPESGAPSYSQVQNGTWRAPGACGAVTQEGRTTEYILLGSNQFDTHTHTHTHTQAIVERTHGAAESKG